MKHPSQIIFCLSLLRTSQFHGGGYKSELDIWYHESICEPFFNYPSNIADISHNECRLWNVMHILKYVQKMPKHHIENIKWPSSGENTQGPKLTLTNCQIVRNNGINKTGLAYYQKMVLFVVHLYFRFWGKLILLTSPPLKIMVWSFCIIIEGVAFNNSVKICFRVRILTIDWWLVNVGMMVWINDSKGLLKRIRFHDLSIHRDKAQTRSFSTFPGFFKSPTIAFCETIRWETQMKIWIMKQV